MFNRAALLNVGFLESLNSEVKFDCIIFHDVDILPEDNRSMHTCEFAPLHLAAHLNKFQYKYINFIHCDCISHSLELCPIESVKAIFDKLWQI